MRIAMIGSRGYPFVYSGYETLVRELAERLVRQGIEVTVYCHKNLFPDRPAIRNGIRLVYLPTVEKKLLSQFIHSLQSFIHAIFSRVDLVLAVNAANGPFGLLLSIFHMRSVINVDGLEWLRPKWNGLGSGYFRWAAKQAVRFFDAVVTDSGSMQQVYRKEFRADTHVIAYGSYLYYGDPIEMAGKWRLADGSYYLVVGRLIPDNNASLIIREFLASGSTKKLVIAGDDFYGNRYASEVKAINDPRLFFTGYIRDPEELAALYLHGFAYIHGHEFGGTNPALLQALGCGCAVLALDTPFSREVLKDEEYGLLYSKMTGNLTGLINRVENDPIALNPYRQRARLRISQEYTWEKIVGQYVELFEKLINDN